MCVLILLIWRVLFPLCPPFPPPLTLVLPLLTQGSLSPGGRNLMETSHSGPNIPKSLILCVFLAVVSVFLLICWQEEISVIMTALCKALFYECSRVSLGVILLLHSLSKTTVFVFTQHPRLSSLRFLVTQVALIPSC